MRRLLMLLMQTRSNGHSRRLHALYRAMHKQLSAVRNARMEAERHQQEIAEEAMYLQEIENDLASLTGGAD